MTALSCRRRRAARGESRCHPAEGVLLPPLRLFRLPLPRLVPLLQGPDHPKLLHL
uniref:Uncharacterized protein n=1 Tax=Anguilla anguilla TaxID=7936 RepID=A0A0E9TJ69_ANGAN